MTVGKPKALSDAFVKNMGKGRAKGSINKVTKDLKKAYVEVFDQRGGAAGLAKWAESNPDAFYAQVSRLLPKDVEITEKKDLTITIRSAIAEPQAIPIEATVIRGEIAETVQKGREMALEAASDA